MLPGILAEFVAQRLRGLQVPTTFANSFLSGNDIKHRMTGSRNSAVRWLRIFGTPSVPNYLSVHQCPKLDGWFSN
jgi:hypothetical protein